LINATNLHLLRRQGFAQRHVDTPHGKLHVLDAAGRGDGPPVVLVHGLSGRGTSFRGVVPQLLARVRRVLLPDLLGHGHSEVPSVPLSPTRLTESFAHSLDVLLDEPAVLFGNSLGAFHVVKYAAEKPDRVCGVVLCSPGGAKLSEGDFRGAQKMLQLDTHEDALTLVSRSVARPFGPVRHLIAKSLRQRLSVPHVRRFLDELSLDDSLSPSDLGDLKMPVLMLWGTADTVYPRSAFDWFRSHLPGHAQVEEPDGFGHAAMIERPRELAARLVTFLDDSGDRS
jgi:pimeloyl-ACP methyl ester carboxylesterase